MGLLGTRWEAEYEGHKLVVSRNEVTRGFNLQWDGNEIAHRTWSLIGVGELHASAEVKGKPADVRVQLHPIGKCTITVDGKEFAATQVK